MKQIRCVWLILLGLSAVNAQGWLMYLTPPVTWTFRATNGYDDNVLRLSNDEQVRSTTESELLGSMKTFDSYYHRLEIQGRTQYRLPNPSHTLTLTGRISRSDYLQNPDKKYYTTFLNTDYRWGPYRHLEFKIFYLRNYYLRHYIDRDRTRATLRRCAFSDARHEISFSSPIAFRLWYEISAGYLQRYYNQTFSEFDLDIFYVGGKISRDWQHKIVASATIEAGTADNFTLASTAQASDLDRSYRYLEVFIPIQWKQVGFLDEIGFAWRNEWRQFSVEDPDDPLHSGRNHSDAKFDFRIQKELPRNLQLEWTIRSRKRTTASQYAWVEDLKTFHQLQTWMELSWTLEPGW